MNFFRVLVFLFCCMPMALCALGGFDGYLQFERLLSGDDPEAPYIGPVTTFGQDQYGFVWIGGESGLIRYDGKDYRFFQDDRGLAGTRVNDILPADNGLIYVATTNGLSVFDYKHDRFINLSEKTSSPVKLILSLSQAGDRVLIGSEQGLYVLDSEHTSITYVDSELVRDFPIHDILQVSADEFWLATRGKGILVLSDDLLDVRSITRHKKDFGMIDMFYIERLKRDQQGNIWVATTDMGVFRYSFDNEPVIHLHTKAKLPSRRLNGDISRDLNIDPLGNILIAIDHGGLNVYNPSTDFVYEHKSNANDPNSLLGNQVLSVFADNKGDVWVGHFPEGLSYLDRLKSKYTVLRNDKNDSNSISNDGILSLLMNEDELWIGTENGLNRYNMKSKDVRRYLHDSSDAKTLAFKVVTDVFLDSSGRMWVATWAGGLNLYNPIKDTFRRFTPTDKSGSLSSPFAWCLEEDNEGNIWVGTTEFGGINVLDTKTMRFSQYLNIQDDSGSLSNNNINTMLRDGYGNMWVGTNHGLNRFDAASNKFQRFFSEKNNTESLSGNNIRTIFEDADGDLWFGTEAKGVSMYDHKLKRFKRIVLDGERTLDTVSSITQDTFGFLWFGTSNGIVRYEKNSGRFRRITRRDGLAGDLHLRNAALTTSRGRLIFGSTNGLTIFDTETLKKPQNNEALYLTDFVTYSGDRYRQESQPTFNELNLDKKISLPHQVRMFDVTFALMSFSASRTTKYSYKLEGFDEDWINSEYRNRATYTNLGAGDYTFHVRVKKDNENWRMYSDRLSIHVKPAPWATWWAWLLYVFLFFALIFFFVISYAHRLQLEKSREINQNLVKMDKIKDEFLNNTSHELRAPLNGMIALAEILNLEIRSTLTPTQTRYMDVVISEGRALSELVNDILDYQKLSKGENELQLAFESVDVADLITGRIQLLSPLADMKSLSLKSDAILSCPNIVVDRRKVAQILTNLISNAIKYTDFGTVTVGCEADSEFVSIYVADTGIGLKPEQLVHVFDEFHQVENEGRGSGGTGLGLTITKKLVELMNGRISCESVFGEGSRFVVCFPVDRRDKTFNIERTAKSLSSNDHQASNASEFRALVVDDDRTQSLITSTVLQRNGFLVDVVPNAENAILCLMDDSTYDVVVSDYNMPGVSGMELCQQLKAHTQLSDMPFVLVTSEKINKKFTANAADSGVTKVFEKPVNILSFSSDILALLPPR